MGVMAETAVWVWGGITSKGSWVRGANDGFWEGADSVGFGEEAASLELSGELYWAEYEATDSFLYLRNSMRFHGTDLPSPAYKYRVAYCRFSDISLF